MLLEKVEFGSPVNMKSEDVLVVVRGMADRIVSVKKVTPDGKGVEILFTRESPDENSRSIRY